MIFLSLIEFVAVFQNDENRPYVVTVNAQNIATISQFDDKHCLIEFKNNQSNILACGTYRHLTNRWIYALEKNEKHDFYHDEILRPSIMIYHRPEKIGEDITFFNQYQLVQFTRSLRAELFETHPYIFEDFSKENQTLLQQKI